MCTNLLRQKEHHWTNVSCLYINNAHCKNRTSHLFTEILTFGKGLSFEYFVHKVHFIPRSRLLKDFGNLNKMIQCQ